MKEHNRLSLWQALLWLLPVFTIWPYFMFALHYQLPTPIQDGSPSTGPVLSERNVLGHIQALQDCGYRTVGTQEAVNGELYVLDEVTKLETLCMESGVLRCEVWDQVGDGMHQFAIMDHAVLKSYKGIRNVILRITSLSDPHPSQRFSDDPITGEQVIKKDAVLLNAHIDSALPSRGAADDAIGVGIMLDLARILVERNVPISGSIIFLFNSAEETLQDASHLYATQHETRHTVRTVINLEAAGNKGPALLFQATSKEMIETYAKSPHPHGTVIAADIFESGVMMSDTDFKQFVDYMHLSGMDMAIVGHSYYYHTRKDSLENIEPGSAQHFGDNVLAAVDHLLSPGSPLQLSEPWSPPQLAYFSLYDRVFIHYSMDTATKVYFIIGAVFVVLWTTAWTTGDEKVYLVMVLAALGSLVASLVGAVVTGLIMSEVLGKGQSWFSHEHASLLLFGPPALTASFVWQYAVTSRLSPKSHQIFEHAALYAQISLYVLGMGLMQAFKIRSAYLFASLSFFGLIVLLLNEALTGMGKKKLVSFAVCHVVLAMVFVVLGIEAVTNILDIFVPLTGRMGREAPTEIIIAILSSALTSLFIPTAVPFFHRYGRRTQRRIIIALILTSGASMAIFASKNAYDAEHPKRLGVQYVFNITSGDQAMHIAQMDRGPGFPNIINRMHERYGLPHRPVILNQDQSISSDWDVLYPISSFLETEQFEMKDMQKSVWEVEKVPRVGIEIVEELGSKKSGVREIKLRIRHTGLVYPVIAFTAEVIDWSFEVAPPSGVQCHYIKAAASPGHEEYELDLTLDTTAKVQFHWSGIDGRQMFPGTSKTLGAGLPSTNMFEDMDAWMEEEWKGALDVLMIGVVVGVIEL